MSSNIPNKIQKYKVICPNCKTELIISKSDNEFKIPQNPTCPICNENLTMHFSIVVKALNSYNKSIADLNDVHSYVKFTIIDN